MMGFLYYGTNSYAVEIDDRTLAHLKIAILSMLRAQKSVAFSFGCSAEGGGGRETLWISPSTDIRFQFFASRAPRINESWVRGMIDTANGPTGLSVIREPADVNLVERLAG